MGGWEELIFLQDAPHTLAQMGEVERDRVLGTWVQADGLGLGSLESQAGQFGCNGGRGARAELRWRRGSFEGPVAEIQARCWAWSLVTTVTARWLAVWVSFQALHAHDVSLHIVCEVWRVVLPRFTDEKTEAQGHWAIMGGAWIPVLQPGSWGYTLTHQALPQRRGAAEMSGVERLEDRSSRWPDTLDGGGMSVGVRRGPGLWGYNGTPSRNGIGGSVARPLTMLCATDHLFVYAEFRRA